MECTDALRVVCYFLVAVYMNRSTHIPVLASEVLQWLSPRPGQIFVDGTLGGGGHTRLIAEAVERDGMVIGLDRDPAAIENAERNLTGLPVQVSCTNFCDLPDVLDELGIAAVDGVILDLGLSSDQLADNERGFSFDSRGPLDLRFDTSQGDPAWHLLQYAREERLADLIFQYGEERFSRRIARKIVASRRRHPIRTAEDLAQLVRSCVPRSRVHRIDPATRTFQALRIAVNDELRSLELALERIPDRLMPNGRFVVISFHSLEDRPVKSAFRSDPRLSVLTKKPVRPDAEELERNPRSRSARLRAAARANEAKSLLKPEESCGGR